MGAYSHRQIGLQADLLDLQAGISIKGALCGGSASADHETAQGSLWGVIPRDKLKLGQMEPDGGD